MKDWVRADMSSGIISHLTIEVPASRSIASKFEVIERDWSPLGIQTMGQMRLDRWLGKDKVKFVVEKISEKEWKFTIWRHYGPWHEDPKRFSDCNEHINSWDESIFLGTEYQTGIVAVFETFTGPYIINNDIKSIFLPKMKQMAKKHHGTRIKSIEVDNNLDHVELKVVYV